MKEKELKNNGGADQELSGSETERAESVLAAKVTDIHEAADKQEAPVHTAEVLPMSEADKSDGQRNEKAKNTALYRHLPRVCSALSALCRISLYIATVAVALMMIVGVLLLFVQIPVDEMLPLNMRAVTDGAGTVTGYRLSLGNSVSLQVDSAKVTPSAIKSVHYWNFAILAVTLLTAAPILFFVGVLLKRIGDNSEITRTDTRLITYAGLAVMLGGSILYFIRLSSEWNLINRFVSDTAAWSPSLLQGLSGIFLGLTVILLGRLIGYRSLKVEKD